MNKIEKGFTLIELILYVAIVAIMMTVLIPFAWNAIETGAKSATEQEVFSNARFISEQIKYQIRNAIDINSVTPTQISLVTANSSTNPTIIALSSGNMTIKQGASSSVNLNSNNTTIASVSFRNYSSSDTKTKNIQFVMTVSSNFPGAGKRQEYNESTTIESDAEIRSN